jgi:ketosteroid isomerase-like protein
VTVEEIIGGETSTVAVQHNRAESGGRALDQDGVIAFRVAGGKITEAREFFQDTAKGDAFWA